MWWNFPPFVVSLYVSELYNVTKVPEQYPCIDRIYRQRQRETDRQRQRQVKTEAEAEAEAETDRDRDRGGDRGGAPLQR